MALETLLGLRAVVPLLAGMSGMRYRRFSIANAIGGIVWSVAFVLLGYGAGASYHLVEGTVGRMILAPRLVLTVSLTWYVGRRVIGHRALAAGPAIPALPPPGTDGGGATPGLPPAPDGDDGHTPSPRQHGQQMPKRAW